MNVSCSLVRTGEFAGTKSTNTCANVCPASLELAVRLISMNVNQNPARTTPPAWTWRTGMSAGVKRDTVAISVNWMWMNVRQFLASMVELVTTGMDLTTVLVLLDSE